MTRRWDVWFTDPNREMEDVGVVNVKITEGGALVFSDDRGEVQLAFGVGVWREVSKSDVV